MITVQAEETETDTPEPVPSDQAADQNNSTDPADAAQMVIDYLEGVRQEEKAAEEEEKRKAEEEAAAAAEAEKKVAEEEAAKEEEEAAAAAEEEQAALEEAAELKAIQVEQDRLNATYTSNTNVIYGYAQKYKYYYAYDVPYTDGYYTRYDRYIYCWDGFPSFELTGNTLKFTGDAIFVTALYSGSTSYQTVSDSINVGGNRVNAYSNIKLLAYPSLYQIDKSAYESGEEIIQVIVMLSALCIGWMVTKRFIVDG